MNVPRSQILDVVRIARVVSSRGEGISLTQAIDQASYLDIRPNIQPDDILELLVELPEFVDDWIGYSEDKRTSGGWYVKSDTFEVGRLSPKPVNNFHKSLEEAVSHYILCELDFWANLGSAV